MRHGIKFFLAALDVNSQLLEDGSALLKIEREQIFNTGVPGIVDGGAEVDSFLVGVGHGFAIDGAWQGPGGGAAEPLVCNKALKYGHGGSPGMHCNCHRISKMFR